MGLRINSRICSVTTKPDHLGLYVFYGPNKDSASVSALYKVLNLKPEKDRETEAPDGILETLCSQECQTGLVN